MRYETVKEDIVKILFTEKQIIDRITTIGKEITNEYKGRCPLVIGILKGAATYIELLAKKIDTHIEIDYMTFSSYGNSTKSSGNVKMIMDLDENIEGRDIIIVEDILDTGNTLYNLMHILKERNPKSIEVFTFLRKKDALQKPITPKWIGFDIENEFVVGYGFDFNQKYRNLDFIGVLNPKVYS